MSSDAAYRVKLKSIIIDGYGHRAILTYHFNDIGNVTQTHKS